MTLVERCGQIAAWGLSACVMISLAVRLTVQDSLPVVSGLYYGTPWQVLSALALAGSVAWQRRGRRLAALALAGVCLAGVLTCYFTAFRHHARSDDGASLRDGSVRVVFWNTARGAHGWDQVFANLRDDCFRADGTGGVSTNDRQLKPRGPDIIALVEAGGHKDLSRWQAAFPEYQLTDIGSEMLVLVRAPWTIEKASTMRLTIQGIFKHVILRRDGQPLHLFLVDWMSNPFYSRRATVDALMDRLAAVADQPVLVAGDFNTPTDSVHFGPLRRDYVNAFEQVGSGYAATWPTFAPVLQIDQIWANRGVQFLGCRHGWSVGSDHRSVSVDLTFSP